MACAERLEKVSPPDEERLFEHTGTNNKLASVVNENGTEDSCSITQNCESNIQDNLNDIIQQLNGDDDDQISYAEFFQTHLSAERNSGSIENHLTPLQNTSNINGKHETLGVYSEAHDLCLESKSLQRSIETACKALAAVESRNSLNVTNKLQEAILSLKSEIFQLNLKLQAVYEEKELQKKASSQPKTVGDSSLMNGYEERLTELHAVIAELTQKLHKQNNLVITEEGEAISDAHSESSKSVGSEHNPNENPNPHLQTQVSELKKLLRMKDAEIEELRFAVSALTSELDKSRHSNVPKMAPVGCDNQVPVLKVAERIKLKTMDKVTGYHISNLGVSRTEVAEHLVSDLTENCDIQELKEKHELEVETERLKAKLEHIRSQNVLLQFNFEESKAHCTRLSILIGKYESNIVALKQALDKSEEIMDIYRSLRDTHKRSPKHAVSQDEKLLTNKLTKLLSEQKSIKSTVVKLESHVTEPVAKYPVNVADARKLDIETAVLMQELMAMREEKSELKAQLFRLEKEREQLELKLFSQELQFQAQLNSQSAVDDPCSGDKKNNTEIRLKERLKEVAFTLERVTRNSELKQQQLNERINQLKTVNSVLAHSLEKCNQKLQTRVRKVETQMLSMAERHASQVSNFKQNIISLEDKLVYYETHCQCARE